MLALLADGIVAETLGGVVGGLAPWVAGFLVLLAGIFGSNEKVVGALPLFFFAAVSCLATFVFAPDTGFWTGVERFGWWGGGILGALGAMVAFNQRGGNMRGLTCIGCIVGFAALAMYSPDNTDTRLERVNEQLAELQDQLDVDVQAALDGQETALREVHGELESEGLSSARQSELETEARDIVRTIMALEQHRDSSQEALSRLRSLKRSLQRQEAAEDLLGSDTAILEEFEAISDQANARLEVDLDQQLGSGVIEDMQVDQRMQELLSE